MHKIKNFDAEDLILLSRICGVSHDLAEILLIRRTDINRDEKISKHLDFITNTLEGIIKKYSQEIEIN